MRFGSGADEIGESAKARKRPENYPLKEPLDDSSVGARRRRRRQGNEQHIPLTRPLKSFGGADERKRLTSDAIRIRSLNALYPKRAAAAAAAAATTTKTFPRATCHSHNQNSARDSRLHCYSLGHGSSSAASTSGRGSRRESVEHAESARRSLCIVCSEKRASERAKLPL